MQSTSELLGRRRVNQLCLFVPEKGVAISYDRRLRPFLGQTRGYNEPDSRTYLNRDICVLRKIRIALACKGKRGIGGRVFLTSAGVFCWGECGHKTQLIDWDWPGRSMAKEVVALARDT